MGWLSTSSAVWSEPSPEAIFRDFRTPPVATQYPVGVFRSLCPQHSSVALCHVMGWGILRAPISLEGPGVDA
jgi:hypothetical protein